MAQKTRDKILEKALQLFNEIGYMEVGVREIARQLEMSPGNLSYHFRKKEDILFSLLNQFSEHNDQAYIAYQSSPPSNEQFLILMSRIFEHQYNYRGVYIGNQFVQAEIRKKDRFDYATIAKKRETSFKMIFEGLHAAEQVSITEEDISFLVSYITLFGRFWISEATLFSKSPDKAQIINHYLLLLSRQLLFFASSKGKKSINDFHRQFL
ncbi:MAG: TetR/AcrR family transcriptional regulator [Bacteroidota bacterium]